MERLEKIFNEYTKPFLEEEQNKAGFIDKYHHSYFVRDESLLVDEMFTRYNPDFKMLLEIESLFHDIGRFEQLKLIGNFYDYDLVKKYPMIKDHGVLGAIIMKKVLLEKLFPEERIFDDEIIKVIKLHTQNNNLLSLIRKEYIEIFKNYSLREIMFSSKTENEKTALTAINTTIIQDADRLDIFRKIVNQVWIPSATKDEISPQIWNSFMNNNLPSINEIKRSGEWNPNVGHLVRLSFIEQMNLIPELQKIKDENLLERIYQISGNEIVRPAYDYMMERIEQIINQSEDKILVKRK